MKLIYVAGPFRGETPWDVEQNIRNAEEIGLELAEQGWVPVIPHTMYRYFDKRCSDEFWLDGTLELMRRCDALHLCPGWERSSGSRAELAAWRDLHGDSQIYEDLADTAEAAT